MYSSIKHSLIWIFVFLFTHILLVLQVFSKSFCPYCKQAKKALVDIGIKPVVVELDQRPDGRHIQTALMQLTGQRTVPNVWLNGKFIGGCDDTLAGIRKGMFKGVS